MPFAARFVQDHSITPLHYFDAQAVTVFYPASSELIHSLGILLMGNDVLSPLINTLWLGLALLASWCIGRPFGVASITLTGSAILFATPGLVATQPGGAYDDVVGLAFFLSAVAMLLNSQVLSNRSQQTAWVVAVASLGLAIGTKWTFIGPAAALIVGAFVLCGTRKTATDPGTMAGRSPPHGCLLVREELHRSRESRSTFARKVRSDLAAEPSADTSIEGAHSLLVQHSRLAYLLPPRTSSFLWTGLVGAPRPLRHWACVCGRHRGSTTTRPWLGWSRIGDPFRVHSSVLGASPICRERPVRRCGRDLGPRPTSDKSGALDVATCSMGPSCLHGDSGGHPTRCWDLANDNLQPKIHRRPRAGI